jgi:hypothetical protein
MQRVLDSYDLFLRETGGGWLVVDVKYCIVGNNLIHDSQITIFKPRTTSFMVKIVKQEHKANDIFL